MLTPQDSLWRRSRDDVTVVVPASKWTLQCLQAGREQLSVTMLLPVSLLLLALLGVSGDDVTEWQDAGRDQLRRVLRRLSECRGDGVARNVVLFVGDGMGLTTVTAAGVLKGGVGHLLSWERFPHVGVAKVYSVDKMVPDSAATATAFLTGVKTQSKMLGVSSSVPVDTCDPAVVRGASVPSLATLMQASGGSVGVVTTARVTHATPAALYAHGHRDWECDAELCECGGHPCVPPLDIARQLVEESPGRDLRVVLGGGRRALGWSNASDPDEDESCVRADGRNLAEEWRTLPGRRVLVTSQAELRAAVEAAGEADYLLGLFAGGHMAYEAERGDTPGGQPALSTMTVEAIRFLRRRGPPFLLLVEGARVDMAHHGNYATLALGETLELDRAVAAALGELDLRDTLVVVTADHSHTMTFNGYPAADGDILGVSVAHDGRPAPEDVRMETLTYASGPGSGSHANRTADEIPREERARTRYRHFAGIDTGRDETHGGEDVIVYSAGPGSELLTGVFEQNYIATAVAYAARIGEHRGGPRGRHDSQGGTAAPLPHSLLLVVMATSLHVTVMAFVD